MCFKTHGHTHHSLIIQQRGLKVIYLFVRRWGVLAVRCQIIFIFSSVAATVSISAAKNVPCILYIVWVLTLYHFSSYLSNCISGMWLKRNKYAEFYLLIVWPETQPKWWYLAICTVRTWVVEDIFFLKIQLSISKSGQKLQDSIYSSIPLKGTYKSSEIYIHAMSNHSQKPLKSSIPTFIT